MSDEIWLTGVVIETVDPDQRRPMRPGVVNEHWCMHAGCARWGSFGYQTRYGTTWFCGEHRAEGERQP